MWVVVRQERQLRAEQTPRGSRLVVLLCTGRRLGELLSTHGLLVVRALALCRVLKHAVLAVSRLGSLGGGSGCRNSRGGA